jgi:MtN3 and saliva related transmembrane protein
MQFAELIGWTSSAVLLATISRQVYAKWKSKSTAGVSRWLFIGQVTTPMGFTIYSFLLHNWIYLASNIALLITAVVGQVIYKCNERQAANAQGPTDSHITW